MKPGTGEIPNSVVFSFLSSPLCLEKGGAPPFSPQCSALWREDTAFLLLSPQVMEREILLRSTESYKVHGRLGGGGEQNIASSLKE